MSCLIVSNCKQLYNILKAGFPDSFHAIHYAKETSSLRISFFTSGSLFIYIDGQILPFSYFTTPLNSIMRDKIEVEARDLDGSLLPTLGTKPQIQFPYSAGTSPQRYTFGVLHIFLAFILGIFISQTTICRTNCLTKTCKLQTSEQDAISMFAPPIVGSTSVHHFPPPSPTNAYPSLFPSNVGHGGETATGGEPAVAATAPAHAALHTGQCSNLRGPKLLDGKVKGQITFTEESVDFKRNANSTCSVAGEI